ncbi:hypothetical protein [Acidimangrovimonas sediminis]|uniref:hypothetical protein n=1 Tax=Acidimangrovimonas sediminis TaxID=2056283 RepID=UPI0011AF6C58|nr:hypothetical protein [Acidimangrovimonas sediminis]
MSRLLKNFRVSVKDNTSAYGYSIAITGITSMMTATGGKATPADLFAGAAGAVCAYILVELAALLLRRQSPRDDGERTRLLARMLNLVSVGAALAVAYLIGRLMSGWSAWLTAGFVGTAAFVLLEGIELYIADEVTSSEDGD